MSDASKVSTGKPKTGGAVSVAPVGTTLPTDPYTALDNAFAGLGYISEEGFKQAEERESQDIKAWGGDIVDSPQTSKSDTFSGTFIESMNENVQKLVHGDENVETGTVEQRTFMAIKANATELGEKAFVVDMILKGGIPKRIVIPKGKVTEVGEVTYVDNEAIGYPVTIKAFPDSAGNTHYEYIGA